MKKQHKFRIFLLELAKFSTIIIPLGIILYVIVVRTLFFLIQDSPSLNKIFQEMLDLRFNLVIVFFLLTVGWFISFAQKELTFVNPFKLQKTELVSLILLSSFFSYFYTKSFSLLSAYSYLSLSSLTIFFLYYFVQVLSLYKAKSYEDIKISKHYGLMSLIPKILLNFSKNLLILALVVVSISYGAFITSVSYQKINDYQKLLNESLFITKISPKSTTYAYEITLEGHNFGTPPVKGHTLFTQYGPVNTSFWSNDRIEFVIPLHWKEGEVNLWIEKPNKYVKKKTISSNIVKLELLNRWTYFPTEHDDLQDRVKKRFKKIFYLDKWNDIILK